MTQNQQLRLMAEGYVLRWLARVGKARVGRDGRLEANGEVCLTSPAAVLRLVQAGRVVTAGGCFTLAEDSACD